MLAPISDKDHHETVTSDHQLKQLKHVPAIGGSDGVWIMWKAVICKNQTDDAYSNLLAGCIELFIVCFANDHYEQLYKYPYLAWKRTEHSFEEYSLNVNSKISDFFY